MVLTVNFILWRDLIAQPPLIFQVWVVLLLHHDIYLVVVVKGLIVSHFHFLFFDSIVHNVLVHTKTRLLPKFNILVRFLHFLPKLLDLSKTMVFTLRDRWA